MEAISAVPSTRGSRYTTWSRHIASGCLHPNTFYRIKGEIMIKGSGDYFGGFSRACRLGACGPWHTCFTARVSRGSEVCRRDAIIVREGSEGPDHATHRQGRQRSGSLVFQNREKGLRSFWVFSGFFLGGSTGWSITFGTQCLLANGLRPRKNLLTDDMHNFHIFFHFFFLPFTSEENHATAIRAKIPHFIWQLQNYLFHSPSEAETFPFKCPGFSDLFYLIKSLRRVQLWLLIPKPRNTKDNWPWATCRVGPASFLKWSALASRRVSMTTFNRLAVSDERRRAFTVIQNQRMALLCASEA